MIIAAAVLLTAAVLFYTLFVRPQDIPEPTPASPFQRLDELRARIYDNLRDLNFEYRVGKLSDEDYQKTKTGLQNELAAVMAEIDRLKAVVAAEVKPVAAVTVSASGVCPSCGARFPKPMRFCGECGKPMAGQRS